MTTSQDIKMWLESSYKEREKQEQGIPMKEIFSHMLVVCDSFDYEDYPVHVLRTEDVHEVIKKYNGENMQRIMEIYNYDMDLDKQLSEHRVWNI